MQTRTARGLKQLRFPQYCVVATAVLLTSALSARAQEQPSRAQVDEWWQQCIQRRPQGEYAQSLPFCQRVVDALERKNPLDAVFARSLNNLASQHQFQGQYAKAEPLYLRSLRILESTLGPDHPDVDWTLTRLAELYADHGQYAQAERLFLRILRIREKTLGTEHQSVAAGLTKLAHVLSDQHKYKEAEPLLRQALAIRQKVLGAEHPDVLHSLCSLASLLARQGKLEAAETMYRQALALQQKLLGVDEPEVAELLIDLAITLKQQGKYEAAETLHRQALAIRQKLLGTEHASVADSMQSLANVLFLQGSYEAAETLHRQALAIREKVFGADHLYVAYSRGNLALVLHSQGRHEAAEMLLRQAVATKQNLLGVEHLAVANEIQNLALVLERQGKREEAETLLRQALAVLQKLLGADHPEVSICIDNLAFVLHAQGKLAAAEPLYRQALAMMQKRLGAKHPELAISLNNLAGVLSFLRQDAESETLARQALAMREQLLGADHPATTESHRMLAEVLVRADQLSAAKIHFLRAAQLEEVQLRAISSESRIRSVLDARRWLLDALSRVLLEHPTDETLQRLVMTTALLRKGRAAEAGALANRLLQQTRNNPRQKELLEKWQQVRQQRETLLFGGVGRLTPSDQQQRLKELGQQADDLEFQLAASLPELRQLHPPKFEDILPAVAARLPTDGALIEVLRVAPFNFKAQRTESPWLSPHYLALVMTADQHIEVKDLGEAAMVDSQVQTLLAALRSPSSDPRAQAKALYDQILKPVLSASVKHLYLSLDGALNLVPFDALHDGTDYLLGRRTFHYLTSGRDLLRTDAAEAKQPALVIADPDFGKAGPSQGTAGTETFYQRLSGLNRLAGAQQEAKQIGSLLHVTPIVGGAAKESVVRTAQSPWLVHIASHGLFLKERDLPRGAGPGGTRSWSPISDRKLVSLTGERTEPLAMRGDSDSLSRSALVLADAVNGEGAASAAEDGLLTAEEARSLDLFGTQLVVLSACDTGQGDLSVGQGVYGLRRAFLVAGAETLVTSLWPVNDVATGRLMWLYYQKLLKGKKGRLAAMQEAMQEMRKKYNHPYYWAPFLVIGSDGPLRPPGKSLTSPKSEQAP